MHWNYKRNEAHRKRGSPSGVGFRACMTTGTPNRQGLKPISFQALYGTVETVPYKEFLVATQALQLLGFGPLLGSIVLGRTPAG